MKRLSILGSTGSIGRSTLDVVASEPQNYKVVALAAGSNIELLEQQIRQFNPEVVAVNDPAAAKELSVRGLGVDILQGPEGLISAACLESADMVVSAIVGSPGLMPTYRAIQAGKDIALATKEALVMAGSIIMAEAKKQGVKILPVDSEHSAVFQCLDGRNMDEVDKIILTASGGAFRDRSLKDLENVTPAEALKHPNWEMGRKITIDSATLMNKGLEVIEAYWLFGVSIEKIDVIIHPQSIVHSMVKFIDGSIIAQLSVPDMKGPISYALSYPKRGASRIEPLNLAEVGTLTFQEPDLLKYPALNITFDALRAGGTMPCVLNAANEVAVEAFLNNVISFRGISQLVSDTMAVHEVLPGDSIEEVIQASEWAKKRAEAFIGL
ncbi:MAG: 1-deoxy-D-xylulose-5-phosphate reductoisomerase [Nitrospira sp.]|nr:1-deoxy-D-xylulose-5-phosphate reductoisomerase [Nitrospira sp.]